MGLEIREVEVTPLIARDFLARNTDNRKLTDSAVFHLSEQMKRGEWKSTGDTIKFSESGRLLDGQHRLTAIVDSDTTQKLFIAEGLDEKSFDVLDSGKSRSAADVLFSAGVVNPSKVAAVSRFAILFERGKYSYIGKNGGSVKNMGAKVTNANVREFVENNPEINDVVTSVMTLHSRFKNVSFQVLGGMYYVLYKRDAAKCEEFFNKLVTGSNLNDDDPVYVVREKFIRASANTNSKIPVADAVFFIAKAWVSFINNRPLKLMIRRKTENFPTV